MGSFMGRNEIPAASPRLLARMTGLLYLIAFAAGIIAQGFISGKLIVAGDAARTAANILGHPSMFHAGFALYMIEMAAQVAMTALLYVLLEPVSRPLSLTAAFLSLAGCAVKALDRVFYLAPQFVLSGTHPMGAFDPTQQQAIALLLLQINDLGAGIALVFFGSNALVIGYLIVRSTFLPRILGAWAMLAGLGWLTFLSPGLGERLFVYIGAFAFLGAMALILWLLVFGVDQERWRTQASVAFGERAEVSCKG